MSLVPPASPPTPARGPLAVVAVSGLAVGLGAASVNSIGYLTPSIQDDLGVGRGLVGAVGSTFFAACGAGSLLLPRVVARYGPGATLRWSLAVVALGSLGAAATGTLASLFGFAFLAGAAYSVVTVATNSAVAAAVPIWRRAVGLTGKTAGGPLVSACFALCAGVLGPSWGWQGVLALLGSLAIGGAALSTLVFNPGSHAATSRHDTAPTAPLTSAVFLLGGAALLLGAGAQALFTWILPFLRDEVELSASSAGAITAVSTACGVLGMMSVAVLSDRLGPDRRVLVLACSVAATALATASMITARPGRAAPVFIAAIVGIISFTAAVGMLHTATVDLAPHAVERASGVVIAGFYLGGLAAPFGFGAIVDAASYDLAWTMATVALSGSCLLCAATARARRALGPVESSGPEHQPRGPRSG